MQSGTGVPLQVRFALQVMVRVGYIYPRFADLRVRFRAMFVFFLCVMTWRSFIHMFFERYGLHEIANFVILSGHPDPNPVVYRFFSLWGFQQLIFCFMSWLIVWRYRSLMALVCGLWIVEWGVRIFYYPNFKNDLNLAIYASQTPPGIEWAYFVLCFLFGFSGAI